MCCLSKWYIYGHKQLTFPAEYTIMWLSRGSPAHRANRARKEVEGREVGTTSSLCSPWKLSRNRSPQELKVPVQGWAGYEVPLFSPKSTPTNKDFHAEHPASHLSVPGLHAQFSTYSCLCPSSSIPRKDPGGLDSSCPTLTLWHVPHDPQRQQVSGLQQVLSPTRVRLYLHH